MEASARTVVSPQRFSKSNLLHFLGGAVAAQRLAVEMEPAGAHKRQNNPTATILRLPFQTSAHIMDPDLKIFESERLITEVE
jgi:hypothetical protein